MSKKIFVKYEPLVKVGSLNTRQVKTSKLIDVVMEVTLGKYPKEDLLNLINSGKVKLNKNIVNDPNYEDRFLFTDEILIRFLNGEEVTYILSPSNEEYNPPLITFKRFAILLFVIFVYFLLKQFL